MLMYTCFFFKRIFKPCRYNLAALPEGLKINVLSPVTFHFYLTKVGTPKASSFSTHYGEIQFVTGAYACSDQVCFVVLLFFLLYLLILVIVLSYPPVGSKTECPTTWPPATTKMDKWKRSSREKRTVSPNESQGVRR